MVFHGTSIQPYTWWTALRWPSMSIGTPRWQLVLSKYAGYRFGRFSLSPCLPLLTLMHVAFHVSGT